MLTTTKSAVIASGASLSDAVNLGLKRIIGIVMPSAWTAAAITLQGSVDGTNYFDLHNDSGTEISITVAASRFVLITTRGWPAVPYVKIRSGTTSVPVVQAAERTVTLVVAERPI